MIGFWVSALLPTGAVTMGMERREGNSSPNLQKVLLTKALWHRPIIPATGVGRS